LRDGERSVLAPRSLLPSTNLLAVVSVLKAIFQVCLNDLGRGRPDAGSSFDDLLRLSAAVQTAPSAHCQLVPSHIRPLSFPRNVKAALRGTISNIQSFRSHGQLPDPLSGGVKDCVTDRGIRADVAQLADALTPAGLMWSFCSGSLEITCDRDGGSMANIDRDGSAAGL
jgi:hypothetical protein